MRLSNRLRTTIAGVCHGLGAVWAIAATLRLIFGVAVTFPLLPPLDLQRVQVGTAFAISLALFIAGALIGRVREPAASTGLDSPDHDLLAEPIVDQPAPHPSGAPEPARRATKER